MVLQILPQKTRPQVTAGETPLNKYQQIGSYAPDVMPGFTTTPLQGLSKLSKNVQHAAGCNDNACAKYNQSEVQKALNGTEVIFICLGTGKKSLNYMSKNIQTFSLSMHKLYRGCFDKVSYWTYLSICTMSVFLAIGMHCMHIHVQQLRNAEIKKIELRPLQRLKNSILD